MSSDHPGARALFEQALDALERKDLVALMALWDADGEFVDPHFPRPHLRGKDAIERANRWAFAGLRSYGFTPVRWYDGPDADSGVLEVWTHHTLRTGQVIEFEQVFLVESRAGLLTRVRAFVPYGPHGPAGIIRRLARLLGQG